MEIDGVLPRGFAVLRMDGKKFSKFTKPYKKTDEFSPNILRGMTAATRALLQQIDGCIAAYTVSDEISLVLDLNREPENLWYGGRIVKYLSVPPSIVAAEFSQYVQTPAYFDAKVFTYSPDSFEEVLDYLWTRRNNGASNAVSSYASRHLGHRNVMNMSTPERIVLLNEAGVIMAPPLVHGILYTKEEKVSSVTYVHKRTGKRETVHGVVRTHWKGDLLREKTQLGTIEPLRSGND